MGQHSPKTGRRPSKYPAFYSFFLLFPFFGSFGSTWVNMRPNIGQHSHTMGPHCPQDRPTYANIGQHSHTMGLHSWAPGRLLGAPWPWHCRRRFSPLRRREGPRPLPPTHRVHPRVAKNPGVLRCFVLFPFFPLFRPLWLKMGQHGLT